MISLLLPLPGTDDSRRNCKGREADGENDAAESRTDKGTRPSYVESAAAASGPLAGYRAGQTVRNGATAARLGGAAARHAVLRSAFAPTGSPVKQRAPT